MANEKIFLELLNSLENDKKPVSGSQVLDFKQLFDSLEENRRKKK